MKKNVEHLIGARYSTGPRVEDMEHLQNSCFQGPHRLMEEIVCKIIIIITQAVLQVYTCYTCIHVIQSVHRMKVTLSYEEDNDGAEFLENQEWKILEDLLWCSS